jgi:hypothetical protein
LPAALPLKPVQAERALYSQIAVAADVAPPQVEVTQPRRDAELYSRATHYPTSVEHSFD